MSRTAEAVLVLATTGLAIFGVLLVNFAQGTHLDQRSALTILMFVTVFGGLLTAVHAWASRSVPFLIQLGATLTAVGFVLIYRLDHALAVRQSWWIMLSAGLAALSLFLLRRIGVGWLRRYRQVHLIAAVILLIMPFIPAADSLPLHGASFNGSQLWVVWRWGTEIVFQPGELARLLLVIFLASYLSDHQIALSTQAAGIGRLRFPEMRHLLPVGLAWIACLGLFVYQRDLGASLLLFGTIVIMLYMATSRSAYMATGFGAYAVGLVGTSLLVPHVRQFVATWFRPWIHDTDLGHQIVQSLFALASGSLSGTGLGLGEPDLVPAAATSYVFAAAAEELGLAGSVVILAVCALLAAIGFGIALRARDTFRKLLAAGLSLLFGLQTILVVAAVVRLLPPSGLMLPFMSYGGASPVAAFLSLVLLARVSHEEQA